jgi:hypothetical protein
LPLQFGKQMQFPPVPQTLPCAHVPQEPPQPSAPHVR